jgi:hypothetical protein
VSNEPRNEQSQRPTDALRHDLWWSDFDERSGAIHALHVTSGLTARFLPVSVASQQNFEYEEVKTFIDTSIEPILGNQVYAPKKVGDWTSAIVEAVLKLLQAANKPFKYVGQ